MYVQNEWEENTHAQYCNISFVLDYKPIHSLLYEGRWHYCCVLLLFSYSCFFVLPRVPEWRFNNNVNAQHTGGFLPGVMYGHTYSKSRDQPGKVANPVRGQLKRENEYFPVRVRA